MIDVFCVLWGDKYVTAYVYALKEAVAKNLSEPHNFKCITARKLDGIDTVLPPVSYSGWWQKIGLFSPLVSSGPSLYFDLDVVITGNLDYLVPYTECDLAAPANWAQSGHGGIQSSVLAWNGKYRDPIEKLEWGKDNERLWGDQEYLWELRGDDWTKIPQVGSYKYHVRPTGQVPGDMRVMVFHGKPDPHEVQDQCVSQYTQTLRSLISSNTHNGGNQDLAATG